MPNANGEGVATPQDPKAGEGTQPQDPKGASNGEQTVNYHKYERDIANRDKAMTKTGAIDSTTTINGTVAEHPIVIITPTEDTPKTEPEKNPTTGANDLVAVAVAAAALALAGSAIILRKD